MGDWDSGESRGARATAGLAAAGILALAALVLVAISGARPDEQLVVEPDAEATEVQAVVPTSPPEVQLRLRTARSPTRRDCASVAQDVGYPVACPRRLPPPAAATSCGGICIVEGPDRRAVLPAARSVGLVIQQAEFPVPSSPPWLGIARELVVTSVPVARNTGELRLAGPENLVSCFPERAVTPRGRTAFRTCVDAQPWTVESEGFPLERHTAAVWRRGDVVYAAGIEGAGDHVDAALTALIAGIEYVEPS